jgi:CubicO group peptidase (beta-lactamase class C family)
LHISCRTCGPPRWGLWILSFSLTVVGSVPLSFSDEAPDRRELLEAFQKADIVPQQGGFIQPVGEFPTLVWDRPFLVRAARGEFALKVRWFDAKGEEVDRAERPGRYGAYVEGIPDEGPVIRRSRTFFFFDPTAADKLTGEPPWEVPREAKLGISQSAWDRHREYLQRFMDQALSNALMTSEQAAILAASLAEYESCQDRDAWESPELRHQEHQLSIRRKVRSRDVPTVSLNRPLEVDVLNPILIVGSPEEAGFSDQLPDRLREFCEDWLRDSESPFTMVVARRGVVVFHEGFGRHRDGELVGTATPYPLFSLTKTLAGTMLGMFLDQGLLKLDDPVGTILPDFPLDGPGAFTFRACMMHVTGLQGHSVWDGFDNPWMDNVVAQGLETLTSAYAYSGVPYDLTGFAMQELTGKTISRLFQDHLFEPLGMQGATITGMGTGAELRAIDLAKLGQMWLQRGTYGSHRFFSDEVWKGLLPESYEDRFPGLAPRAADYGSGTQWVDIPHPRAGEDGLPVDAKLVGNRTLGHGSFSGTVFRVDLENEVVIAVGRFSAGPNHRKHLEELLLLIDEAIE